MNQVKLLGEEGLPEAEDPGLLVRKGQSALFLVLVRTQAAFLPCLQPRKRQQPKQQQQHSSALDPWRSWCLHGSDGRRNIYISRQVDWRLGRKEDEFLVKDFDKNCCIAAQKPPPLLFASLLPAPTLQATKAKYFPSLSCSN